MAEVDAWTQWEVVYRDVIILDRDGAPVGVFNLTEHDLSMMGEYAALKGLLLDEGRASGYGNVEVSPLLGGNFAGFVVEERQRALLGVATSILEEMSGGRYGFADDFAIVDRASGQPRSAKTLSGGETFQASLALALGLVELAGRSGGRLNALFLDEGFGTLDTNALDEALEELERRAQAGRVIGVIAQSRGDGLSFAVPIDTLRRISRELERRGSVRRAYLA